MDNPNPRAGIAIICHYPFFIDVNWSVYEALGSDVEFVFDPATAAGGTPLPETAVNRFREIMHQRGAYWRDYSNASVTTNEFFSKYHTLVGNLYQGAMKHPVNRTRRKVRVFYGVAKDLWMYGLWNAHFDLICSPGEPFSEVLRSLYPSSIVVNTGEPKLDLGYGLSQATARAQITTSPHKQTLLFLVTWGALSSARELVPVMKRLAESYNVVFKPHHMVATFEPDTLAPLEGTNIQVVDYLVPVTTAVAAADVVISDNSGAIFDAVVMDMPIALIDLIGPNNQDYFNDRPFHGLVNGNRLSGAPTSRFSLEQQIKQPENEIAPVAAWYLAKNDDERFTQLHDAVVRAGADTYRQQRKNYRDTYFLPFDGAAGERVAQAIRGLGEVGDFSDSRNLIRELVHDYELQQKQYGDAAKDKIIAGLQAKYLPLEKLSRATLLEKIRLVLKFW